MLWHYNIDYKGALSDNEQGALYRWALSKIAMVLPKAPKVKKGVRKMSNTPLTDRAEYSMYGSRLLVDADFARELERQLSAANARIVELQGRLIAQENKNKQIKKCSR